MLIDWTLNGSIESRGLVAGLGYDVLVAMETDGAGTRAFFWEARLAEGARSMEGVETSLKAAIKQATKAIHGFTDARIGNPAYSRLRKYRQINL